jgi:hypothetical protein
VFESVTIEGTRFYTPTLRSFTGTNPAANAEFSETVPATKAWLVLGVSVTLVQGITQTPWPSLILDDGTNTLFQAFSGTAAQSASTTTRHSWGVGVTALGSGASTANTGPLAEGIVLSAGFRIRSSTTGIGANSDYGAPQIYVVQYGAL